MSMITGCPACGTMFRVVPDQLKISEGWVRCGHCGEVFDAAAHLKPEPAVPPEMTAPAAEAPRPSSETAPDTEPVEVEPIPAEPVDAEPVRADVLPEDGSEPTATLFRRQDSGDAAKSADFVIDVEAHEPTGAAFSPSVAPPQARARPIPGEPLDETELEDVSFVRQARRRAFWRRPAVRVALLIAALVLGLLLAAQYAVQERNRLAAVNPGMRPWLALLCQPLGCTIGPPQRIESVVIESSGFTRLRADAFRLSFSVRNQSAEPVAVPALQLTLTDLQEQAVLQRVLTPRELGATSDTIAPASEFAGSVVVTVSAANNAARVAGYRVLAFYP
ncbi:DUF3426 domain-containing protein [Ramlibacter henchirensis]|uniref:DUF3426 domain-containing protein n=1 Tax=Ramlibacter henchirensis TaxID=204072 RepID=A0A4Z0C3A5_9BURK|nr:DUF3426 domain-containing protein [Ramlibacter henchirensis]TFZ05314.1 DUF3426 domain-containing protein [Ramlibacter henchirensis]